jgi:MFS family permease
VCTSGILKELDKPCTSGFKKPLDDTENGLLQTAFIVSYMLCSPVFGYLGDRFTRKYIITGGILAWAGCTLLGSFSVSYEMLVSSRALVGIGEASYATIAPTIIADLFPARKRLRMLSIFYIAMPLGSALGYIIGSRVSQLAFSLTQHAGSWKWALRITPLPAVVLAILVCAVVQEPPRGHTDGGHNPTGLQGKSGVKAYFHDVVYCLTNKSFMFSSLGYTAVTFTVGALAQFAPLFILRASCIVSTQYKESTADLVFGGVTVVAGIVGTLSGSELAKFLGHYTRKSDAIVCILGVSLGTPCLFLALTVVQYRIMFLSWVMVFLAEFFFCLNWAPVAAVLLYTVIPTRRATAEAIQILMQHLLGDAFSPLLVGALSDAVYRFFGHNQTINGTCDVGKGVSLEFALFTTVFVCAIGVAAFLALTLSVAADRKAVEQFSQCQGGGGGASSKEWEDQDDSDSDAFDHHSGLLSQAVREHMYSSINT